MFSFQALCESFTTRSRFSWFYLDKILLHALDSNDLSIVHIEHLNDGSLVRVWYPKSRWDDRPISEEGLRIALSKAIDEQDFEEIKKIKDKLDKLKV